MGQVTRMGDARTFHLSTKDDDDLNQTCFANGIEGAKKVADLLPLAFLGFLFFLLNLMEPL